MKTRKRLLAALLCICMILSYGGYTPLAAGTGLSDNSQAETVSEDDALTTEAFIETDEARSDEALDAEASDLDELDADDAFDETSEDDDPDTPEELEEISNEVGAEYSDYIEYLVIGSNFVVPGEEQFVLVGLKGEKPSDVILNYSDNQGNAYKVNASALDSEYALFYIDTAALSDGVYTLSSIDILIDNNTESIDLFATGIDAAFGVNVSVDVSPYGWLVDENEGIAEDVEGVVYNDVTGDTITADDIFKAIDELGYTDDISAEITEIDFGKAASGNFVIVLDPGHGGSDTGATRTYNGVAYIERDMNLKIAQACKAELESYGLTVYMTRYDNNTKPGLGERAEIAASYGADLFISIHNNSSTGTTAYGSEVWIPNGSSYNYYAHEAGELLGNKIINNLAALGLNRRGVFTRNATDGDTYPTGETSDYYTVINETRRRGIPGMIIEHAYVSNQSDATTFLGSDASLKKLGVADAQAIYSYYQSMGTDYDDGSATVTAVSEGSGNYTLVASGVPKAYNIKFVIKAESGKTKETGSIQGSGTDTNWYANFNVGDIGETGKYTIEAHVAKPSGKSYRVGQTSINVAGPSGGSLTITNYNEKEGSFDVTLSGVNSPNGINKVEFPVWSASDGSNIFWYTAAKQSDGSYKATVKLSNHGNLTGTYAIQSYVTDSYGLKACTATAFQYAKAAGADVSAYNADGDNTIILIASNVPNTGAFSKLWFVVTAPDGSTQKQYEAAKQSDGRWLAFLNIGEFKQSGKYTFKAYDNLNNKSSLIGESSFNISSPTASGIEIKNVNNNTGTFDIVVTGVKATAGVASVTIPAWTAGDLSDLYWYTAAKQSDGTYVAHANIKNHQNHYGTYAVQAYVKANNGIETVPVSMCYNIEKPVTLVWPFDVGDNTTFIIGTENIPCSSEVAGVKVAVWHDGLTDMRWYNAMQDDLGRWLAFLNVKDDYKKSGIYFADSYVVYKDGREEEVGVVLFRVFEPTAQNLYVSNANSSAGTFDVVVSGISSPSGLEGVRIPAWTSPDLSDLHWYDAEKQNDGTYKATVNVTNHKGHYGVYVMQAYLKSGNGLETVPVDCGYYFAQSADQLYEIAGTSSTTVDQMVKYYNKNATYPSYYAGSDAPTIEDFCKIYYEECQAEGIKAEVAFCQCMKETGFLKFGGDVKIEQYNFCGLGAVGGGAAGQSFDTVRLGIRAHVQHLKAYANDKDLVNACVDPRFSLVKRNTAPYVEWLGINENPYGKGWAVAVRYGYSLRNDYMNKLLGN